MIVSIDIGTSYSSICRLGPDGRVQPVDISTGASMFGSKYSLPSAVFVEDSGNVLVGQAAMNSRKHRPQNFRMEFKRNLGEDVPILLGERSFLPEDLYTELFRHMKACAEKVDGEQVERAFLTYPASYGKKRKEKLCAAAKAAGLFDLELVDEPTAAAMCYCAEGYIEDGQTLLVYDFGGGTFDVSVIRYKDGAFRLLAEPEGLERCGGMDIDYLIARDMWETVGREAPDGLEALEKNQNRHMRFTSQLNELAVKAKHHLSAAEVFEEYIEIGADDVCYRLTAERFNEMAASLIGQTIQICRHALEEAGVSASELSAVLLVGGTSRIPLVKEMAQKISGKQPLCAADLELAVAQGALEYCIYQERDKARQEEEIKAKERTRQEAEEKERKKQEAAEKKAQQEAEEKKRKKQEEEARERESREKVEKDREWEQYLEKKKQRERDLERILRRREEEVKARQEKEARERARKEDLEKKKQRERDLERILRRREEEAKARQEKEARERARKEEEERKRQEAEVRERERREEEKRRRQEAEEKERVCRETEERKRQEAEARAKEQARREADAKLRESDPDAWLGQFVEQFIATYPNLPRTHASFSRKNLDRQRIYMNVPQNEKVLLAHDTSLFRKGGDGFIFTGKGIYSRLLSETLFTGWNDFQRLPMRFLNYNAGYVLDLEDGTLRGKTFAELDPLVKESVFRFLLELQMFLRAKMQESGTVKAIPETVTLMIERGMKYYLMNTKIAIWIDDKVYEFKKGESVKITLTSGIHYLRCPSGKAEGHFLVTSNSKLFWEWESGNIQIRFEYV